MSMYCYNEACTKDFLDLEKDVILAKQAGFDLIELRFDCINKYLEKHTLPCSSNATTFTVVEPTSIPILRILSFVFYTLVGCKSKEDVRDRTGSETSLNIIYFSVGPASGSRDSRLSMTSRWG